MDETAKTTISIIIVLLYIIGISVCAYSMSSQKGKNCDACCKFIKKYNFFGDRADDDPRIYYNEV